MPRTSGRSDLVEVNGEYRHDTPKAWLIDFGLDDPVWVPKSQVELEEEGDGTVTVTMPEWLALEKGLI